MRLLRPYQQSAGADYDLEKPKITSSSAVFRTLDKAMVKAIAFYLPSFWPISSLLSP
jgi:hypothetical protein